MGLIIGSIIGIYLVWIIWCWHNLGKLETTPKIAFITIGYIILYGLTFILFQISKKGIHYPEQEMVNAVQNLLVILFAGLNSMIILPQIAKWIDYIKQNQMDKQTFQKKIFFLILIFCIILWIEVGYMRDTQEGILTVYQKSLMS